jgi:hypothetical protein
MKLPRNGVFEVQKRFGVPFMKFVCANFQRQRGPGRGGRFSTVCRGVSRLAVRLLLQREFRSDKKFKS